VNRHARFSVRLSFLLPACGSAYSAAVPEEPFMRDVEIISRWPQGDRMSEDRISADLYRPRVEGHIPAAVIINSSGGINSHTEPYYAHVLARHVLAALLVGSFAPHGVRRTADNQNRVPQSASNADAIAGFRWLAGQSGDPSRIIVLGMSRGGEAAYSSALEGLRRRSQATDVHFAAHVAITPGSCNFAMNAKGLAKSPRWLYRIPLKRRAPQQHAPFLIGLSDLGTTQCQPAPPPLSD
jgi:dienelactone hydrolase